MRIISIICLFVLSLNTKAQQFQDYPHANTLYERTWLATDRDVYIPGDKILVALATIDGYFQIPITFSKVAYIELYTANGIPLIQEKGLLENGKGTVQINLPKSLETNYYYLRAYTNYQKNFGKNSFMIKKIRIINPFTIFTLEKKIDTLKTKKISYSYLFRNDSLMILSRQKELTDSIIIKSAFDNDYIGKNTIRLNDSTLAVPLNGMKNILSISLLNGEKPLWISDSLQGISLSINKSKKDVQYTINGIQDTNALIVASAFRADHGTFNDTYCNPENTVTLPSQYEYQPELTCDLLFGEITNKTGGVLPKQIIITNPQSVSYMKIVSVKQDSSFKIEMDNLDANAGLIITPTDTSSSIMIKIKDEFYHDFETFPNLPYFPENYLGTYIQSLMVNVQLADAFEKSKTVKHDDPNTSYGIWDEKIDFDKFINLPSLEEYIHELLPSVYVIKKRKHKLIRISDYNSRGFIGKNPLLTVDGTPFFNHGTILYIPPQEIKTIYVLNRKLTYQSAQFDGVLDIRTRNNYSEELNKAANILNLEYISPKIYFNHKALFSNTQFWQTSTNVSTTGRFSRIQNGQIKIKLQGLSSGKPFEYYSEIIK